MLAGSDWCILAVLQFLLGGAYPAMLLIKLTGSAVGGWAVILITLKMNALSLKRTFPHTDVIQIFVMFTTFLIMNFSL